MAETLESFLTRQLREVSETGKNTKTVRLIVAESGQTFDRWDDPLRESAGGPGASKLAEEIEDLCRGYADSFPSKGGQVMMAIVAEDGDGNERGRHLRKVTGTNTQAKQSLLGGDMSIAEGARIHVETTKQLLASAVAQNNLLTTQIKNMTDHVHALMLMSINDKMRQMEDTESRVASGGEIDPQTKYVLEKLGEIAGPFAELVGPKLLEGMAKQPRPAAPQAPPTAPKNGVPSGNNIGE